MPKKKSNRRYPGLADSLDQIASMALLNQGDMAKILGVPQSSLSEWMSATSEPSRGTFALIAERFGVKPEDLAYGGVTSCTINGHAYGAATAPKSPLVPETEETEISAWLKTVRERWKPKPMPRFYKRLGVLQQSWSHYENNEGAIPAWILVRAIRQFAEADDIRWLIKLTSPIRSAPGQPITEAELAQKLRPFVDAVADATQTKEDSPDADKDAGSKGARGQGGNDGNAPGGK